MSEQKYAQYVRQIRFQRDIGSFELSTVLDESFFGWDNLSLRYGLVNRLGVISEETDKLHCHDYDQLLWLVSADPHDMLELGAEVEVTLGETRERYRFSTPTVLLIPKGLPHYSPMVRSLNRRFYFLGVNCSGKPAAQVLDEVTPQGNDPWSEWGGVCKRYVSALHFSRMDPYHYGSRLNADSGGVSTLVSSAATNIPITMSWGTVTKKHQMGPRRPGDVYLPHKHPYNEALMFLSLDQNNLTELHAEADCCMGEAGEDQEHFRITQATAVVTPPDVSHLPLVFRRVDEPMVFFTIGTH